MPTKVHLVKDMIFPVVMYGYKSWTIKKAEHGKIDAFELWSWRRLLRVPWTARRSKKSILKEISPKYSLEELMLKLKLQYFGHLMLRTDSMDMHLSKLQELVMDRDLLQSMGSQRVGHDWATELNWTHILDYETVIALTWWTFVGKVMSLLFNMLSSLVIGFLPRSKF